MNRQADNYVIVLCGKGMDSPKEDSREEALWRCTEGKCVGGTA